MLPVLVQWDLVPVGMHFVHEDDFEGHEPEASEMQRLTHHQWVKEGPLSAIWSPFVDGAHSLEKAKKLLKLLPDGEAKLMIWPKWAEPPDCVFIGRGAMDRLVRQKSA
jgi:hypothetical protein